MARLDKTIKDYQEHLTNKGIDNIPEFIQSILDADITKGKYSRFLLDCYLDDKFRSEDLQGGLESTIGHAVSLFHKHKNKLPEEQRSIYKYDSPGDLWNAVKQFDGELSGKEIKRSEQEKIYTETEFVYKDEESGLKIITPLTIESAKWWGKGTRWCTSADKNNMFFTYAKQAPLLIFLMPKGEKLQLWKNGNSNIQFMDEADNEITLEYVESNWDILEPIVKWIGKIKFFPKDKMTQEICMDTIHNNGGDLQYIPKNMITEEICKIAIQQDGLALFNIPVKMKTEEIYKMAVQKMGHILECVPKKYQTEEVYKLAIQNNGLAIQYIPQELRTEELCKIAIKSNGRALFFVPKQYITEELCRMAVQQNGHAVHDIPEQYKTEEFYKIALQQNGYTLDYIPEAMRTEEMYKLTVQQNGSLLYKVPFSHTNNCRTEKICELAVQKDGLALQHVPEHIITKEISRFAVQQNGWSIKYVPENLRTEELYRLAVEQNRNSLQHVPEELQEQMKHYIKPTIIPQEKYQQVFSEIRSCFPEKSLSLTL